MAVPGYTEIRELGHGGTGRVVLAVRDSDGLPVAIKHLSEALRADGEFAARFRAEAGVIGEIDSPHTARLLDYVEAGGTSAIVMELVDGVTLRRLIAAEGGTGVEAALTLLKGALLGLAEAHRRGVAHRDFKPENVIVTPDGDSKLVDFGVAARFGETGALAGTPAYMSPEQWEDAPAGPACDVYAAALVFYECLTGRRPFTAANLAALAFQHQHMPPPLEHVDGRLRGLVEHGLAKDPAHRPASAEAFLAELEEVARGTYGAGWELRGRSGLAVLAMPFAALLPSAGTGGGMGEGLGEGIIGRSGAEHGVATGTSVVRSSLGPPAKLGVTGGLVLATAAAVASTFVIWSGSPSPDSGIAMPPESAESSFVTPPVSPDPELPVPSGSGTVSPPVTATAGASGQPTAPAMPTVPGVPTAGPVSSAPPATRAPNSRPPRPTSGPSESGPPKSEPPKSGAPSEPASGPPSGPPTRSSPTSTRQSATGGPVPKPPATSAPAPEPSAKPPAKSHEPLLSVSVGLSLGGSLLGGGGGGLLDADLDVGLGSSLLGMLVVPGSALLGGRIAVRRARRSRSQEKS
ncbi:protein kinase [Nonomuraea sp. NPDC003560]|uniref:serine/threonine-protein kinase n=1 Tax=Nonomuraea sp. NPDC003560 TaxID=3364341 RepID=UPI0036B32AD5